MNENSSHVIDINKINTNNLGQHDRLRVLGCEPVDVVLDFLSINQVNIATFVHQMGDVLSPLWCANVAIFI